MVSFIYIYIYRKLHFVNSHLFLVFDVLSNLKLLIITVNDISILEQTFSIKYLVYVMVEQGLQVIPLRLYCHWGSLFLEGGWLGDDFLSLFLKYIFYIFIW